MTTLEEFVRDGVVYRVKDGVSLSSSDVCIKSDGELVVDLGDQRTFAYLSPTALRALSAMALWAAGQMEKKR